MDEKLRQEVGLFRFSVIGPLINGELVRGERKKKIAELSKRVYTIPGSYRRSIGKGTIEEWLLLYRKHGLEGLYPKERKDRGACRSLKPDILDTIIRLKREQPRRPMALICQDLYQQGILETPRQPLSTLYRYLAHLNLKQAAIKKEMKRYQTRFANELWQADVMHGPRVPHKPGGPGKKTYLFAVIDDASRLIVGAGFYPSEKLIHLKTTFRDAVRTYGVPGKFYVDNGRIFKARELEVACAKINTILIYATPYYPAGKGKIEKYFRRVRDQFITGLRTVRSLEELNQTFQLWLAEQYNRAPHAGIEGEVPLKRYLRLAEGHIRRVPAHIHLEELFYKQETRIVNKDATFRINNVLYEAPEHLINNKIEVFFDDDAMERIMIRYRGKDEGYCTPVDYLANAKIKRKTIVPQINFNHLFNNQENRS